MNKREKLYDERKHGKHGRRRQRKGEREGEREREREREREMKHVECNVAMIYRECTLDVTNARPLY